MEFDIINIEIIACAYINSCSKVRPLDAELKALWDKNITGIIESDQSIASQLELLKEQMEQVTEEERAIIKEAIQSKD
ncbi:hypothetical protein D3C87_1881970 [compost metagenome]